MSDIVNIKVYENTPEGMLAAIADAETRLDQKIDDALLDSTAIGDPTAVIVPTGNVHILGVGPGTYANWGGLVVPANNIGTLKRVDGVFSVSLTLVDLSGKLNISDLSSNLNSSDTSKGLNLAGAKELNDSKASKAELTNKANLESGKNKFNKAESVISGKYLDGDTGAEITYGTGKILPYIPIKAGQTLFCNAANQDIYTGVVLYDESKTIVSVVNNTKQGTAAVDGFIRFSVSWDFAYNANNTQVEVGTAFTSYEPYILGVPKAEILEVNESAIPETIARVSELEGFAVLVADKNKFNKADATIDQNHYFDENGTKQSDANSKITHKISIKAGQTMHCNSAWAEAYTGHKFTDVDGLNPVIYNSSKNVTAPVDGFVEFSIRMYGGLTIDNTQVEIGTAASDCESYKLVVDPDQISNPASNNSTNTEITVKRLGTSGVDADFCGLNAIGDALASITDASETNRYTIIVEGHFLFTLQSDFAYSEPQFGEPTVIIGKNWVNVEGKGKNNTVVAVKLDSAQTFTGGKVFTDFQPTMWNCNSKLSKMKVISKNCRYSLHIESGILANDVIMDFEDVEFEDLGSLEMVGGYTGNSIGTGMRSGQTWNFKNGAAKTINGIPFAVHTALEKLPKGGNINFTNWSFWGNIYFNNYPFNTILDVNFDGCLFNRTKINYISYYSTGILADYSDIKLKLNTPALLFNNDASNKGRGLKIESKATGITSSVKFDQTSSAFNLIIGNSNEVVESQNSALNKTQFGYQWKKGGVGLAGYAIGGLDIDSSNSAKTNGLGVLLGNCSVVNKTLTVIVDGTTYNIVFNENFTAQNNAYVIAKITAVIGSVANVSEFNTTKEYYPEFSEMESLLNEDTTAILKGMGIVFTNQGMRRALNSDNHIDGICLYDTVAGEYGRCIKKGLIYAMTGGERFSILEDSALYRAVGVELGISATAGIFSASATPKLLRAVEENVFKIL